jgi:hypothetical protein
LPSSIDIKNINLFYMFRRGLQILPRITDRIKTSDFLRKVQLLVISVVGALFGAVLVFRHYGEAARGARECGFAAEEG